MKTKDEWYTLLKGLPKILLPRSLQSREMYHRGVDRIAQYRRLGILGNSDNVLDVGFGASPTAIGLEQDGNFKSFVGIDVKEVSIKMGKRMFGKDQRFQFIHANVKSTRYQKTGHLDAAQYKFPFGKNRFDLVSCNSLFTHIGLPAAARNYLDEMWRVMKPGAFAYTTWYRSPPYKTEYGNKRTVYYESDIRKFIECFEVRDLGGCTEANELMKGQWRLILRKPD